MSARRAGGWGRRRPAAWSSADVRAGPSAACRGPTCGPLRQACGACRWAYDSDLMPPGYPLWRYTMVRSALFEVITILSAFTMITWSPVSMCGANVGLCLPRRMRATSVQRRPSTMPSASTTCHSRWISLAFGVYVAMPQSASIRWGRSLGPVGQAGQTVCSREPCNDTGRERRSQRRVTGVPSRSRPSTVQPLTSTR